MLTTLVNIQLGLLVLFTSSDYLIEGSSICSPLPYVSLTNGKILVTGRQKFRFVCDRGYFLTGSSQIRCWKGNWTSTNAPLCLKTEGRCDPAPGIPNGDLLGGEDFAFGSIVQYICHPGHMLLGNSRRMCLRSGDWSGGSPSCLNESEPVQNIAERLDKSFVTELGAYAENSSVQQSRYLDKASLHKGLELVILIDRSSSVDPFDLEIGKHFLKFLFKEFNIQNGNNTLGARAAVLAFGTNVDILFNLNDENIDGFKTASDSLDELLKPGGGGTAMMPALTSVFLKVEPLLRKEAKRALFLITDGEPNIGDEDITPEEMAANLKKYINFEIFTMGIGPDVNRQLLTAIASEPVMHHVFLLKKYSDLDSMMSIMKNRPPEEPPISPQKCGHGGESMPASEWPWLAAVYASSSHEGDQKANSSEIKLCGGALICSEWVLTAASCFYHIEERNVSLNLEETFVALGEYNLLKMDRNQMNFYAEDVVIHPEYNPLDELLHNLALVRLNNPVPLGEFRTICLPPTDKTVPLHMDLSINASVAGWGIAAPRNDIEIIGASTMSFALSSKLIALSEERECRQIIGRRPPENLIFCAESAIPGQCTGIIGSPVVAQNPVTETYHVLGILSRRKDCDRGHSQYIQLTKYIKWINDVTSKCHFQHWN